MNSLLYVTLAILYHILQGGSGEESNSPLCDNIATLDCSSDATKREICASNGVTYNTSCEFAKAHCKDLDIHIVNEGPCFPNLQPDPICSTLVLATCPTISNPVCASDGNTYNNFCDFEKNKCNMPGMSLISLGTCPTTTPPPTTTTGTILDIICQSLVGVSCPIGGLQACGSDGVTYDSGCELEKASCKADTPINLVNEGPC